MSAFVRSAPPGTLVPATAVLEALADREPVRIEAAAQAPAATWREKLWSVPAETRLGIDQLCEALERPRSWCYRHTSSKTDLARLPHRKLDGQLVFVAGEIRTWIERNEIVIERGISSLSSSLKLLEHKRGA